MIPDIALFATMALGARGVFAATSIWPSDVAGWLALAMVALGAIGLTWRGIRKATSAATSIELVPEHAVILEKLVATAGRLEAGQERIEAKIDAHTKQDDSNFAALNLRFNKMDRAL